MRLCPADNAGYAASQDCHNNSKPYSGVNLNFVEPVPSCYPEPGFALILYGDGNAKMGWGWNVHAGGDKFNFPPGQQPSVSQIDNGQQDLGCSLPAGTTGGSCPAANDCGGNAGACAYAIATMDVVRYQIASDPTDNNQPALFRSNTGGFSGVSGSMPTAAAPPGANWQLIARGIEDLQVRYRTRDDGASGSDFWTSSPPVSTGSNPDLIVREVEVTLWSRAIGPGSVTGETTAANGVSAVRGSLTMRASPRASLDNLVGAATNRWQ